MKDQIILWLCSIVLVFLIGYIKSITGSNYPITGTFGIEGKKVSYKLDKETFDKSIYKNIIISDVKGIEAKLLWRNNTEENEIIYSTLDNGLECEIPNLKPGQKIQYRIIIKYNDKSYEIPKNQFVRLTFWGSIPSAVNILFFIFMYGAMVMSFRSLLEAFTKKINLKKFAGITCSLFIVLNILIYPLYNSYKLGAINHFVPPFSDLVNTFLLIVLIIWISGTIMIFNKIYIKTVTTILLAATVLIFFLI